jgi:hypothetical protein
MTGVLVARGYMRSAIMSIDEIQWDTIPEPLTIEQFKTFLASGKRRNN